MALGDRLAEFVRLTDAVKAIDKQLADAKSACAVAEDLLRTEFEHAGISNAKLADGRVVYLSRTLWASAKDGDRLAVTRALTELGATDLITQTYNANQLSSYVREFDRNGEEIPAPLADVITVFEKFQLKLVSQ